MPALDPYNITNKLENVLLDVIVTRLELRGKHPFFENMLREYVEAMEIDESRSVLDIGCGTGVAARHIAHRAGFSGNVLGIDLSPYLVDVAGKLAAAEGLEGSVAFQSGDTHSLELGDATFDAVVAHTLLSHVGNPVDVLTEARRVAKPEAMIGVFDGDYASMTFEQEDPEKSKADDEKLISALITQPRVMRQIPQMAKEAGLELVRVFPYVLAEVGRADFWLPAVESFRTLIPKTGVMSEAEADTVATALTEKSEQGVFFGACNFYGYLLKRP